LTPESTWGPPMRLLASPEVTVIELVRPEAAAQYETATQKR